MEATLNWSKLIQRQRTKSRVLARWPEVILSASGGGLPYKKGRSYPLGVELKSGFITSYKVGALVVSFRVLRRTKYNRRRVLFENWYLRGLKMPSHTHKFEAIPSFWYRLPPAPGLVQIDYLNMNGKPFIRNIGLIYPLFRESKYCNFFLLLFLLHLI